MTPSAASLWTTQRQTIEAGFPVAGRVTRSVQMFFYQLTPSLYCLPVNYSPSFLPHITQLFTVVRMQAKVCTSRLAVMLSCLRLRTDCAQMALNSCCGAVAAISTPRGATPSEIQLGDSKAFAWMSHRRGDIVTSLDRDAAQEVSNVVQKLAEMPPPHPEAPERAQDGLQSLGTVLEGRRLSYLNLQNVFLSTTFNRADLRCASWSRCRLESCTFDCADLTRASITNSTLRNVTFQGACLKGARLTNTKFANCIFRRADLREVDVSGAVFHQCDFSMSDLTALQWDAVTMFFDPQGWGACRRLRWKRAASAKTKLLDAVVRLDMRRDSDARGRARILAPTGMRAASLCAIQSTVLWPQGSGELLVRLWLSHPRAIFSTPFLRDLRLPLLQCPLCQCLSEWAGRIRAPNCATPPPSPSDMRKDFPGGIAK